MPGSQKRGAQGGKKRWNLSKIPDPLKQSAITYLLAVDKTFNKAIAVEKLRFRKEHQFQAKKTTYWEGKVKVTKIINEQAQKALWDSEHDQRITCANKVLDEAKVASNELFAGLKEAINHLFTVKQDALRAWDPGYPLERLTEEKRCIFEQLTEAAASLDVKSGQILNSWRKAQLLAATTRQTKIQAREVREAALDEEQMRSKSVNDQLSDLRLVVQHALAANRFPRPRPRGNTTKRAGSRGRSVSRDRSGSRSRSRSSNSRASKSSRGSSAQRTPRGRGKQVQVEAPRASTPARRRGGQGRGRGRGRRGK